VQFIKALLWCVVLNLFLGLGAAKWRKSREIAAQSKVWQKTEQPLAGGTKSAFSQPEENFFNHLSSNRRF